MNDFRRHIINFFSILYGVVIGIGFRYYCDLSNNGFEIQKLAQKFESTNIPWFDFLLLRMFDPLTILYAFIFLFFIDWFGAYTFYWGRLRSQKESIFLFIIQLLAFSTLGFAFIFYISPHKEIHNFSPNCFFGSYLILSAIWVFFVTKAPHIGGILQSMIKNIFGEQFKEVEDLSKKLDDQKILRSLGICVRILCKIFLLAPFRVLGFILFQIISIIGYFILGVIFISNFLGGIFLISIFYSIVSYKLIVVLPILFMNIPQNQTV